MTSPDPRAALADELEAIQKALGKCSLTDVERIADAQIGIFRLLKTLRSPSPYSQTAVTDEMVTAAMREFERMSSVLRYREKDKWHSCDIMGMRDALRAAFALLPDPSPYSGAADWWRWRFQTNGNWSKWISLNDDEVSAFRELQGHHLESGHCELQPLYLAPTVLPRCHGAAGEALIKLENAWNYSQTHQRGADDTTLAKFDVAARKHWPAIRAALQSHTTLPRDAERDANRKDAEEFCKGAFGPFVTDVSQYVQIVTELLEHASNRASVRPRDAERETIERLAKSARSFAASAREGASKAGALDSRAASETYQCFADQFDSWASQAQEILALPSIPPREE